MPEVELSSACSLKKNQVVDISKTKTDRAVDWLILSTNTGAYSEGEGAGGHAPSRRLSGFFMEKNLLCWDCSLYQKCSVDLKYAKNALAPDPAGGAHDAPPDRLVGWGGGHPLTNPHPSRRLWRLDSRAFGAQLLWPPM